jgi:hypothetical protein
MQPSGAREWVFSKGRANHLFPYSQFDSQAVSWKDAYQPTHHFFD